MISGVAGQKDEVVPVTNAGLRKRHRSDPALVRACLAGRPEAWRELIDRYGRLVHSIPRRYGWSEADADDVFPDVARQVNHLLEAGQVKAHVGEKLPLSEAPRAHELLMSGKFLGKIVLEV